MKKLFWAIALLLVLFSSCSHKTQKKQDNAVRNKKQVRQNQEFIFDQMLAGKSPKMFDTLMYTRAYSKGFKGYAFEQNNKNLMGIKESTGFYSDALDNGDWVDDVLLAMEEARMGEEILTLLEDESLISPPIIEETDDGPVVENAPQIEKIFRDSNGVLKSMQFGTEYFIPQQNNGNTILVHYSAKSAIRLFYDDLYRLVKKELWKMESINNAAITGLELYEYNGDSKIASTKTIQTQKYKTVSKLNADGLLIETKKYEALEAGEATEFEYNSRPVSVSFWKYDDQKRITEEAVTEYAVTKQKSTVVNDTKQRFIYNEGHDIYEYYENGSLKIKTEYGEKGNYVTTIYFDSQNSVITYYQDYIKLRDVYMYNGIQTREKVYEQPDTDKDTETDTE